MKAIIAKKEEIAKDTLYVEYNLLDEKVAFVSGQYFHVLLKEGIKHHFTFVNSPNQNDIVAMCTRLRDSVFKNTLRQMPIGSEVEIYKIKGEFVLPELTTQPLVFVALGIGVTPYISMLRYISEEKLPFSITMYYTDTPFLDELEGYTKTIAHFTLMKTKEIQKSDALYYVSGPPVAVESVKTEILALGIPEVQIKTENFTGY